MPIEWQKVLRSKIALVAFPSSSLRRQGRRKDLGTCSNAVAYKQSWDHALHPIPKNLIFGGKANGKTPGGTERNRKKMQVDFAVQL